MLIKRIFRSFIFKKYDLFAEVLGFKDWNDAQESVFFIYHSEGDTGWYSAELPNQKWAVWEDEGKLPYPYKIFDTWREAITYLRRQFERSALPEHHWMPEGFDETDPIFSKKPDRNKQW